MFSSHSAISSMHTDRATGQSNPKNPLLQPSGGFIIIGCTILGKPTGGPIPELEKDSYKQENSPRNSIPKDQYRNIMIGAQHDTPGFFFVVYISMITQSQGSIAFQDSLQTHFNSVFNILYKLVCCIIHSSLRVFLLIEILGSIVHYILKP